MLNAVLWLTGICLCQSEYRPASWNLRGKSLEPWHRLSVNQLNNSRLFRYYHKSNPCYKPWPLNFHRRILRPPFQFYPYYTENPLRNCLPFLNPHYSGLQKSELLETAKIQNHRNILTPMDLKSKIRNNRIKVANDLKFEEMKGKDYSDALFNDTCLQLPKNDTMIISPTILIGQKKCSWPNDNWILSNKPVNIYVKKLPSYDNLFKISISSEKTLIGPSRNKSKKHKIKYHKNKQDNVIQECYVTTPNFFQAVKRNFDTIEDLPTSNQVSEENCIPDLSSIKNDAHSTTTENCESVRHPVKKKIFNTLQPYICHVDFDELVPDNENCTSFYSSTKLNHNNAPTTKHRREVKKYKHCGHSKANHFKRFYYFPNLRRCSKRSCMDHKLIDRMDFTTESDKLVDYFCGPDYINYYEYNSDDDLYPQNSQYKENIFLNDYSYVNDMDPNSDKIAFNRLVMQSTNAIKKLNSSSNHIIELTTLPGSARKKCSAYKEYALTEEWSNLVVKVSTPFTTPASSKKSVCTLNNPRVKQNVRGTTSPISLNNMWKNLSIRSSFDQDSLIKNLTDELERKMSLLTNLTFDNLLDVKNEFAFDCSTVLTTTEITETMCPIITTTCSSIKNTIKKPQFNFDTGYEEEIPLLDSMFVSPNKAACEKINSRRCVCSPCGMINFFSNELQKGNDAKIILKKLITYSCEVYTPITKEYQIAADMKPRLISKKKRELIESEFGPKEITPLSFDELMMRGIPREGVDFFVFPSTTVEIPCFTSDEMKLSPNIADSALYRWSHSNLKAITEGRILEDANHKGSLIIQDVTLADSDNYTCNVKYIDPDTQVTVKRTFVHAVKVVILPRLALHTNLHYSASSLCDQELLEMFELYLPQQIEASICTLGKNAGRSLCTIEIHNPVCYTKNKQDSMKRSIDPRLLWRTDFQKSRWIREILNEDIQEMEISLNYELDLTRVSQFVPEALNWTSCSPHCQQKLSLKTIEILRDSFLDALLLPVNTKLVHFQPSLDSINIKMLTACDGGLELKNGFCVPCKKHHYSEQGKTMCMPCPPDTFQDNIGAKSCIPCPHPFRPNCFYLGSMRNFSVFIFVVIGSLALLSICWISGLSIRNKAIAKKKAKRKKPEPLPPDFE